MTDNLRLVQNLANFFRGATPQQVFLVAESLADELEYRGLEARLEARALQCALLPAARAAHAAIYSQDCTPFGERSCGAAYYGGGPHAADCPAAEKS